MCVHNPQGGIKGKNFFMKRYFITKKFSLSHLCEISLLQNKFGSTMTSFTWGWINQSVKVVVKSGSGFRNSINPRVRSARGFELKGLSAQHRGLE
jgi:hypothetical protein